MNVLSIETPTHGRVLFEARDPRRLLVGFHGYADLAETHLAELHKIEGTAEWSLAAVQSLNRFYTRTGEVVGNWMTKLDRELAIADNIEYVRRAVAALPPATTLVFIGFSQGASMAARAAAAIRCDGLIMLGGDVPPDVSADRLPPALLSRGTRDDWYTDEKFNKDLSFFGDRATPFVFEGGHEWSEAFRAKATEYLNALIR
jgi:predicted esterase